MPPDPIYISVGHAEDVHTICLHPKSRQLQQAMTHVTLTFTPSFEPSEDNLIHAAMMLTDFLKLEVHKRGLVECLPNGNERTIIQHLKHRYEI